MTMTDAERALFVKQPYRYAVVQDSTIKSKNSAAIEVTLNTNLLADDAQELAENLQSWGGNPRFFTVEIEGILTLDSFVGGPPSFLLDFPKYKTEGRRGVVVSASPDFGTGRTTIGVRLI